MATTPASTPTSTSAAFASAPSARPHKAPPKPDAKKRRPVSGPPFAFKNRTFLQQPEVDFDLRFHRDGLAILEAGFEFPLLDGFHRLFVQAQTQAVQHAHVDRLRSEEHTSELQS